MTSRHKEEVSLGSLKSSNRVNSLVLEIPKIPIIQRLPPIRTSHQPPVAGHTRLSDGLPAADLVQDPRTVRVDGDARALGRRHDIPLLEHHVVDAGLLEAVRGG